MKANKAVGSTKRRAFQPDDGTGEAGYQADQSKPTNPQPDQKPLTPRLRGASSRSHGAS